MGDETVIIPVDLDTYILGRGVTCRIYLNVQDIMHVILPQKKFEVIEFIAQAVSDKINKDRMMFELTDRFSRIPTGEVDDGRD